MAIRRCCDGWMAARARFGAAIPRGMRATLARGLARVGRRRWVPRERHMRAFLTLYLTSCEPFITRDIW